MVRINFNLRSRCTGAESPIRIILRWNGKTLVYASRERIDPKYWSDNDQRAKRSLPAHADFNMNLSNLASEIERIFRGLTEVKGRTPSKDEFRLELDQSLRKSKLDLTPNLFRFIEQFIEQSTTKVNPESGEKFAHTTIKKYRSTYNHLTQFAKSKRKDLNFENIDIQFYDDFNAFLTLEKGLAMNSIGKYIQTIKTFLRAASDQGIEVNPTYKTRRFKTPSELTDKIYLTEDELNEMFRLDLSDNPRLEQVRDLFIVGAWTGLRFSDFTTIQPEQISEKRLRIRSNKTGTPSVIPFHPCVRAILAKYHNRTANSLPPAISNQKMNAYLKEVAALVESLQTPVMVSSTVGGFRKSVAKKKYEFVTTHTARRSFATNMYKMECPTRSIMNITGHKTESAFRAYIRLDSEEHADILEKFMKRTSHLAIA
jgi:integrase